MGIEMIIYINGQINLMYSDRLMDVPQTIGITIKKRRREMRKRLGLVFFAVTLFSGITAFADSEAVYSGSENNRVNVTETASYKTVVINKVSDNADESDSFDMNKVVYMDQGSTSFEASASFMIKTNPSYGKYKVLLGSSSGDAESTYFYIGVDPPVSGDGAMTRVGEELADGTYKVGYYTVVTPEEYNGFNSIKVGYDSSVTANPEPATAVFGGYDLREKGYPAGTVASGSGNIKLAFQINDVPVEYKDSITVYLSADTVGSEKLNPEQ